MYWLKLCFNITHNFKEKLIFIYFKEDVQKNMTEWFTDVATLGEVYFHSNYSVKSLRNTRNKERSK